MELRTPTTHADLIAVFGANNPDDPDEVKPMGPISDPMWRRLVELGEVLAANAVVTLARDWEGCICALVEGDERFDCLAFTEDGAVGFGGVNQPRYFDTVAEYLDDQQTRYGAVFA